MPVRKAPICFMTQRKNEQFASRGGGGELLAPSWLRTLLLPISVAFAKPGMLLEQICDEWPGFRRQLSGSLRLVHKMDRFVGHPDPRLSLRRNFLEHGFSPSAVPREQMVQRRLFSRWPKPRN